MNLSEFKAWFEGFTEDMDGSPNAKQWKRIKKRVGEIDDMATSYPVYIDRYYTPYRPYWTTWTNTTGGPTTSDSYQITANDFQAAGRAESLSINA